MENEKIVYIPQGVHEVSNSDNLNSILLYLILFDGYLLVNSFYFS